MDRNLDTSNPDEVKKIVRQRDILIKKVTLGVEAPMPSEDGLLHEKFEEKETDIRETSIHNESEVDTNDFIYRIRPKIGTPHRGNFY